METQDAEGATIYRSDNNGDTWTQVSGLAPDQKSFMERHSATYGWVFGQIRVDPNDENIIYTMGIQLNQSTDGGKTWQYVEEAIKMKFWLQGVSFRNDKDGFAVGARGTVVHTEDGGPTWKFLSGISYEMPEFKMPEF